MSQEPARHNSSHQLSQLLKVIDATLNQVPVKTRQDLGENQRGSQQGPAWFPRKSPRGLMNSPPGATAPSGRNRAADNRQSWFAMGISVGNVCLRPTLMVVRTLKVQNYNEEQ